MSGVLYRRRLLATAGAAAVAVARPRRTRAAAPPITIIINQSPWFEGFRRVVERYEQVTGNRI
jgi:multiple sugar transport system substrate-binding protein